MKLNLLITLLLFTFQLTNAQIDVVYNNLVWSDEFSANGAISPVKWHHQTQIPAGGNWYNSEVQHYTNQITNSFVDNDVLKIVAKKEPFTDQGFTKQYTSARLNSKFAFTYGRVDVRAKVPLEQGTWPALWLLGKNISEPGGFFADTHGTTGWPACGEIDIMEHGITPSQPINYVQSAMHTPSSFGNTVNHGGTLANNLGAEFHVYSMNWSPFQITFLLDGVAFYTYNPEVKNASTWPFTADQYLLFNIAMGGVAGNIPNNFTQATMEVDYVRVYQNTAIDTQAPTSFTATLGNVTSSTVELLLNALDNSGSVVYSVDYNNQNINFANPSGVQKSLIIPNLSPNTSYNFTIKASDIAGNNATNNPIFINATTTGVIGCSDTSTLAQQGSFSTGYKYSYETLGNSVKITYTLLDTDKVGVVAYLWKQTPFGEVQMTQVSGNTFTSTVTGLTQGENINYGVKFAYQGGLSVTNYYTYQVGSTCNLDNEENYFNSNFTFQNPAKDFLKIHTNQLIDSLEIYDLLGNLVLKTKETKNEIEINHLQKGIYLLNIFSENRKSTQKLIVE
jgi:beta-glucanase (GH16 family)